MGRARPITSRIPAGHGCGSIPTYRTGIVVERGGGESDRAASLRALARGDGLSVGGRARFRARLCAALRRHDLPAEPGRRPPDSQGAGRRPAAGPRLAGRGDHRARPRPVLPGRLPGDVEPGHGTRQAARGVADRTGPAPGQPGRLRSAAGAGGPRDRPRRAKRAAAWRWAAGIRRRTTRGSS